MFKLIEASDPPAPHLKVVYLLAGSAPLDGRVFLDLETALRVAYQDAQRLMREVTWTAPGQPLPEPYPVSKDSLKAMQLEQPEGRKVVAGWDAGPGETIVILEVMVSQEGR